MELSSMEEESDDGQQLPIVEKKKRASSPPKNIRNEVYSLMVQKNKKRESKRVRRIARESIILECKITASKGERYKFFSFVCEKNIRHLIANGFKIRRLNAHGSVDVYWA